MSIEFQKAVFHTSGSLSSYQFVPGLTAVFLLGSVVVPSDKLFFGWVGIYLLALFFTVKQSVIQTLIISFVPVSIFNIGQTYTFLAVQRQVIWSSNYPDGRSLFFVLSPFVMLLVVAGGNVLLQLPGNRNKLSLPIITLLASLMLSVMAASKAMFFPELSMIFALKGVGIFAVIILAWWEFHNLTRRQCTTLLNVLASVIGMALVFEAGIAAAQIASRSLLGLTIEQTNVLPAFGQAADENPLAFRPVGLDSHANNFANSALILLVSFSSLVAVLLQAKQLVLNSKFITTVGVLSAISVLISQSRAAYLALAAGLFVFGMTYRRQLTQWLKKTWQAARRYRVMTLAATVLVFIPISILVLDRVWRSQFSFTASGGFTIRQKLLDEAIALFRLHPVWGVGPGMFIPANAFYHLSGVTRVFPESVHQGFILYLTEHGWLAAVLMVIFYFLIIRQLINSSLQPWWIVFSGMIVTMIPMLFHPFVNLVTMYTVTVIILLAWSRQYF